MQRTRDKVGPDEKVQGREPLIATVRQQGTRADKPRAFLACRQSCCRPIYQTHRPVDRMRVSPCATFPLLPLAAPPMTTISIPLSDERIAQLRLWAEEVGLPPEEFLRRRVEQMLDRPDEQFQKASEYLLQKNAELYRRLA